MLHSEPMFRRLAASCLFLLLFTAGCGSAPLLSVSTSDVTVEPNATSDDQRADIGYQVGAPAHVVITLVSPNGDRVTLRENDRSPDSYSLPFSGLVEVPDSPDRRVLKDGTYTILFQAQAPDGQRAQQQVKAIVKN